MLPRLRLHDFRHQVGDFAGRIEFSARLASLRGEVPYQVLVGVAKQVVVNTGTTEWEAPEVVDDCDQFRPGQAVLGIEVHRAVREDAIELRSVRTLDCQHGIIQGTAKFPLGLSGDLRPKRFIRHDEIVHPGVSGKVRIPKFLFQSGDVFQINVVDALVEEECKDVATKFRVVSPAPEQISGLFKKRIEFRLCQAALRTSFHSLAVPVCSHKPRFSSSHLNFG